MSTTVAAPWFASAFLCFVACHRSSPPDVDHSTLLVPSSATTVPSCVPGPLPAAVPRAPVHDPSDPGQSAALGPDLFWGGDVDPGETVHLSWPATDGTTVTWYAGDGLADDCAAIPGDPCLWVADAVAIGDSVAADGEATLDLTLDGGLVPGDVVVVQAVADGVASPVHAEVVPGGANPFLPSSVLPPGTFAGLTLAAGQTDLDFETWVDAGETLTVRANWSPYEPGTGWYISQDVSVELADGSGATLYDLEGELQIEAQVSGYALVHFRDDTGASTLDLTLGREPSAVERSWYFDADLDGWGGDDVVSAAIRPAGASDLPGDCDDADATVHPDADETCDDGLDADCDGVDACGDVWEPLTGSDTVIRPDLGVLGLPSRGGDLTGDGADDLVVALELQTWPWGPLGAAILPGPIARDGFATDLGAGFVPGVGAVGVGDLDGDGIGELAFRSSSPDLPVDKLWVVRGPILGTLDPDSCGTSFIGAGYPPTAQPAPDTDGDGIDDLAIGAVLADDDGYARWSVGLFGGIPAVEARRLDHADIRFLATDGWPPYTSLPVFYWDFGDLDGDGVPDLALDVGDEGELAVWNGPFVEEESVETADIVVEHIAAFWRGGLALGDWDGDGDLDLATEISSYEPSTAGLFQSPAWDAPFATVEGPAVPWADSGLAGMANAGDLDGDGFDDLLIAPAPDADHLGATWVRGPFSGAVQADLAPATGDLAVPVGDVTGDGRADLAIGLIPGQTEVALLAGAPAP